MKKRLWAAILSSVMCVSALPLAAFADTNATEYDIWVNGEQFTSENLEIKCGDGSATYDETTNEITLENAAIDTYHVWRTDDNSSFAIGSKDKDIIIKLLGDNSVEMPSDSRVDGIVSINGGITVTGSGSLDVKAENDNAHGIDAYSGIVLDVDGDMSVAAGLSSIRAFGDVTISGDGNMVCTGTINSLWDHTLTLNGNGDITIVGTPELEGLYSEGPINISGKGKLNISNSYFGIEAYGDVNISGSKVVNIAVDSCGMRVYDGDICISENASFNMQMNDKIQEYNDNMYGILLNDGSLDLTTDGDINIDTAGCVVHAKKGDVNFAGTGTIEINSKNDNGIVLDSGSVCFEGENSAVIVCAAGGKSAIQAEVKGSTLEKYALTGDPDESNAVYKNTEFTVSFDMGGHGTAIDNQIVEVNNKIDKPEDPTEDGCVFKGWYKDSNFTEEFDFAAPVIKKTTVYAKWLVCTHDGDTEVVNDAKATCTEDGYTGDICCKICGAVIEEGTVIPAAHEWMSKYMIDVEPTETSEGSKSIHCRWCDETKDVTVIPVLYSTPSPSPEPSGEPTPEPSPEPSGEPTPSGAPSGEPTPTTSPEPSGEPTPTPSEEPTPEPIPELNVGDFINRCYEVALGREADEEGFEYWVSSLNNGEACGAQVGYGFIFSEEYTNKNRTNEEFVNDMYAMYFGREADAEGLNYWVEMLNSAKATREDIMAGFANSDEFFNLCSAYDVVCGTYLVGVPNDQQSGVNGFVSRLYKVFLNRLPDHVGQTGWVQKLTRGEVTGSDVAYGFVFSLEFVGKGTSNADFVKCMYSAFFGREADQDGLNYWVEQLNAGTATREDIFAGFSGSAEFANLCGTYGINA